MSRPAPSDLPYHPDRLARAVAAAVGWAARYPWLVLAACLGLAAASVYVSIIRLEYHTQRNDLLAAEKECQKRWQRYLTAFGDDDDMVVVVEGADREQMKAALDAVAAEVRRRPDLFDRVFHRVDLRPIHDRALLLMPADQLREVRDSVERMGPLVGPLAPVAWQHLSLESLLATAAAALDARTAGHELTPAQQGLLTQLPAILGAAAGTVRDPAAYRNPWAVAGPASADRGKESHLTEPQYFFTPDGSLAVLTCRPHKAAASFTPAKEANDAMRAILAGLGPQFPGVKLGLTGLPVLETDEMVLSDTDSTRASWLALLGVAVLYFVVYRGFRYPLLTVASLVCGTVWALGWATVTIGHLNILSATFAVMLIGMGDYGVLWVARYDEGRGRGMTIEAAMRYTAEHAGPSVLTAAVTTALAFFATMLADFKAVAELGWIAGSGVLLCAFSCLTLMPASLVLVERLRERRVNQANPASTREEARPGHLPAPRAGKGAEMAGAPILPFPTAWLPGLARRPRLVLGIGAVLLLACGAFAGRLTYDHNLLHMQPAELNSVAWEHKLIERSAGATWDSLSIAHTREEAIELRARYEALPEVGRVVEVASLVPPDQAEKLADVRNIHARLSQLPGSADLPTPPGSSPEVVGRFLTRVRAAAGSNLTLSRAAADLAGAVAATPAAAARLTEFDRRLVADLSADLHHLQAVSRPAPITLDDLPPEVRERYVGKDGQFLVRAFAKDSLWDYPALQRFTTAAATADPEATGKAFRTREGLRQMKAGFEWAGVYALIVITLVLLLDFRSLGGVLLGLFPLIIGALLTLGVMGLCGVALNPANMIAMPLIVGVGIDNGVHVLHDYRCRPPGVPYRLGSATGRGVLVAALTTILGFATLMTARHRGMQSLGLALTLGVTFCMVAALVWLPAILRLLDERRLRRAAAAPAPRVPVHNRPVKQAA